MRVSEPWVRHASEVVLISAVVHFAKKKRIIRYLSSLQDGVVDFLWPYTTCMYSLKKLAEIENIHGTCEDFDQYQSLQPFFEREWLYLKYSAQALSMTGLSFLILSIRNGSSVYHSLWVVAVLSYQMGAIILFNLSLSSLLTPRRMWATEDASPKKTYQNNPIFPSLPQELEQKILSYLDVNTLIRCQSVSKSWHDAIAFQFQYQASRLDVSIQGGLSNWQFTNFSDCPLSPQGVTFLSEASTSGHLNILPIARPQNRAFTPKMLHLPPHPHTSINSLELSILTLNGIEYLFYSGMRIPLADLLDPFKQWRFRHYDTSSTQYHHPYPLAIDQKRQSFYFIKDGMLHSAPLDHPLEKKSYVNFNKSIQNNPAIDKNGILYFSSPANEERKSTFYAIDPQNPSSPLWSYTFDYPHITTPTIDRNGIIYVGCSLFQEYYTSNPRYPDKSTFFIFDPKAIDPKNPQPCWSKPSYFITAPLTISSDQKLYLGTCFNTQQKLSFPSGTSISICNMPFSVTSPIVIDTKKRVFVTITSTLHIFNSSQKKVCEILPKTHLNNERFFPLLLDIHGRVFVTTSHGRVFGIQPDAILRNTNQQFDCSDPAVFYKFDPRDYGLKNLSILKHPTMDSHGRIFMVSTQGFLLCLEPTLKN